MEKIRMITAVIQNLELMSLKSKIDQSTCWSGMNEAKPIKDESQGQGSGNLD